MEKPRPISDGFVAHPLGVADVPVPCPHSRMGAKENGRPSTEAFLPLKDQLRANPEEADGDLRRPPYPSRDSHVLHAPTGSRCSAGIHSVSCM
jgi:hypothetical protein